MTLDLNPQEAQQLLALLDLAVKAGGLQAAQPALALAIKIQAAAAPQLPEKQP
jgi:predicted DNA-binding transcriptional regulator YafY